MDTTQVVTTHQGTALAETRPTSSTADGMGSQQRQGILTILTIRIGLKPERVQDPVLAISQEDGSAHSIELTVNHSEAVTLDFAEPLFSITLHARPEATAAAA